MERGGELGEVFPCVAKPAGRGQPLYGTSKRFLKVEQEELSQCLRALTLQPNPVAMLSLSGTQRCPGLDARRARLPLKPSPGLGRALVLTHASLWVPWEAQNDSKKEVVDQGGGKTSEVRSFRGSSKCRREIASSLAGGRKAHTAGNNFMANATPRPGGVGCAHSEGSRWHWDPLLNRSLQNG